ncbi:duplicated atpase component cbru of energizing module of putative cobalamin ecf transporter [hydrocarbon metagenome]|uniref:Duplicated atpase component cbru of energizing module of putative cobalamin ecf transporter n=1 Tax=hydrocarbon metagenome TaxID=938273 RepID=A0A0W8E4J9_9ZZZZ
MADIKIQDLSYYYPDTIKPALNKINLEIPEGQFVLMVGNSGSGKSTLLRTISGLAPGFYNGILQGKIFLDRSEIDQMTRHQLVQEVGIVFQNPESQLVMMSVEQEMAFGLENIGLPDKLMKRRVMEISSSLGLSPHLESCVAELSGGQKQKVALAGVLAMHPGVLLLDEPTSQLDPVAAEELLNIIRRLNEDNGITIIMIEQRLERCCHLADRILVMENGIIAADLKAGSRANGIWMQKAPISYLPPLPRLFARAGYKDLPLTVKKGRQLVHSYIPESKLNSFNSCHVKVSVSGKDQGNNLVDIHDLWFTYPNSDEVLKNVNLKIKEGDFIAVLGENGAGKTTLLKNINGLLKPSRGCVKVAGKDTKELPLEEMARSVAYLSQDPNDYLFMPSVREEIQFTIKNLELSEDGYVDEIISRFKLDAYSQCNPRDLSTGERQRVALASVLISRPRLLLLDEPTRGFDYQLKEELGNLLLEINRQGTAVMMVTHDVDFAAEYARDICLMFDGGIIEQGSKYEVLQHSTFYSPQIGKLFNNIVDDVITVDEGVKVLLELNRSIKSEIVSAL